jgi:prolyl oligopeptidase
MSAKPVEYFETREDQTVQDDFYGTIVKDPYRWLEDDRSAETAEWVTKQNNLTTTFLSQIPFRNQLHAKLLNAWNYERYSSPFVEGDFIYWYKNDGLQNQAVCYRKNNKIENALEEVFLDPNTWSENGTSSLSSLSFTNDGKYAVYYISHAGSDVNVARFVKTDDNTQVEPVELKDIKFSGADWYQNDGLFYSRYDFKEGDSVLTSMTDSHRVLYHALNTPQGTDKYIFGHKPDQKRRYVHATTSEDNNWLFISAAQATSGNELWFKKLNSDNYSNDDDISLLVDDVTHDWDFVDCVDDKLYLSTNWNAPNQQLLCIDLKKYQQIQQNDPTVTSFTAYPETYTTIFAENPEAVLSVSRAGQYLMVNYEALALSNVSQYTMGGVKVRDIALPGPGTAFGLGAKRHEDVIYYGFTSYVSPSAIFKLDLETGVSELYKMPEIKIDGLSDFVSKQVFYTSKDGTKISMIITYNPNKVGSGPAHTMLYGYGGFNISLRPTFAIPVAMWISLGGIYAVPGIRGGGEGGSKWHKAGTKFSKQNVFDDFIAAGEYLIKEGYTTKDMLCGRGGSNGGLLIGACMTQRPDLFRVAIPMVGVLDMLRYHKSTAGCGWAEDYLHSEQGEDEFKYLYNYSPVHNVKEVLYPATMITTSDHDDRVVPGTNSYKFAANLQKTSINAKDAENNTTRPVLIRIDIDAGHGAGKSTSAMAQEHADIQSFALFNMGWKGFD